MNPFDFIKNPTCFYFTLGFFTANFFIFITLYLARSKEVKFLLLGLTVLASAARFVFLMKAGTVTHGTMEYFLSTYMMFAVFYVFFDYLVGKYQTYKIAFSLFLLSSAVCVFSYFGVPTITGSSEIARFFFLTTMWIGNLEGLAIILYAVYIAFQLFKKVERENILYSIAVLFLVAFGLADLFDAFFLDVATSYMIFGSILFIICFDLILLIGYSRAFNESDRLNTVLQVQNASFSRFVPKELLRIIGKSDWIQVQLGDSSVQDMAIVFTDIRGFSTISEKLPPELVFQLLNRVFGELAPIVAKHNGIIIKYLGDGFLSIVHFPVENAVNMSLEIQEKLHTSLSSEEIEMGIGIHRGSTIFGTIGDENRMEATVISDAVNVASRLEGLTKKYGKNILMSKDVYELIAEKETYRITELGSTEVKGRKGEIPVYSIAYL